MAQITYRASLISLSVAAFLLLWGVMAINGTIDAMDLAQKNGYFPTGRPLKLVYSGFPPLDSLSATLVAFFDGISNGDDPGPRLHMMDFCATLQTAGFWTVIGGSRIGDKPALLRYPAILVTVWNVLGAATLVPIYFLVDLGKPQTREGRIPVNYAKALIPAAFIGLALPYMLVLFPLTPTTTASHQTFIAIYQFSPIICWAIQSTVAAVLGKFDPSAENSYDSGTYTKAAYFLGAFASAFAHIGVLFTTVTATDPAVSLRRLFVPVLSAVKAGSKSQITDGAHLFMQFDFIIVCLAGAIYSYKLAVKIMEELNTAKLGTQKSSKSKRRSVREPVEKLSSNGGVSEATLIGLIAASTVLLGPGATVSLTLWARESWVLSR